jgi:citrate synthase
LTESNAQTPAGLAPTAQGPAAAPAGLAPTAQGPAALPELRTAVGIAMLGQQVIVHGKDLHHECLGLSFVHFVLFSITGRSFEAKVARVLEQLWIATGYPDARIWCNRIAAYLGSARVDAGLALSAAIAASNSVGYGFRALDAAYLVQRELPTNEAERARWLEAQLDAGRVLAGYGRPVHKHDERIAAALQSLADAELKAGPALHGAFWLDRRLREAKGIEMNIAALWAALAIDFGLDRREYEAFMLLMFVPGYLAVYKEQRDRPALSFLAGYQTRAPG